MIKRLTTSRHDSCALACGRSIDLEDTRWPAQTDEPRAPVPLSCSWLLAHLCFVALVRCSCGSLLAIVVGCWVSSPCVRGLVGALVGALVPLVGAFTSALVGALAGALVDALVGAWVGAHS